MSLKKPAHQLFTDRDEPRKAYWDALRLLEEHPRSSQVITYYGEGGIGKSWLLSELKRNTERMYEEGSIPLFDDGFSFCGEYIPVLYNLETSTDTMEILCQLRYALYQLKPDLAFPLFDCAVRKYMDLSGKKLAQPSSSGSSVLEKYGNFLDTAAMFIPGLGTLNTVYNYVKKGGSVLNAALQKIENKQIRAVYREYFEAISCSETVDDITDNIAEFFKTDLNNSERDYSIIFMIDTFELLAYTTGLKEQSWLTRELAKNTENTLWVFAGRNRIYADDNENEHLLGDLSKEDTLYYLHEKIGITDEDINERIYEISHGTPIFLDICVQNYRNEGNPSIEDYKNLNKELLLKRYIKYLSDAERLVIRLMSSMSHWTDADYKYVFNDVHSNSYSQYSEAYNNVVRSTMIEKDNEDRYFLHRAVRAGIYEDPDYPAEVRSASLTAILNLYINRAEEGDNPNYYCDRIIELIRSHASYREQFSEDDTKLLRDAVFELLPCLFSSGTAGIRELNALFDEYMDFLCYSEMTRAHILAVKWTMLSYLGRYSDSVYTDGYSYRIYEKIYGKEHPDTLSCMHGYAQSLITGNYYDEALVVAEELYILEEKVFGEEDIRTMNASETLADICERTGQYERALELYQKKYDTAIRKNNGIEDRYAISALRGIAKVRRDLKQYNEAVEACRHIYAYYVKDYGDHHPHTIKSLNDLAVAYNYLGDYQKTKDMYAQAYERSSELLGKDHPGTLTHLSNLAGVYRETGEYDKALLTFEEVYHALSLSLGKDHQRTIRAMISIGGVYELKGEFEEAQNQYEEAFYRSEKRYGEDHQLSISCLESLAWLAKRRGQYEISAALHEKIFSVKKRTLGEDHPDTISALKALADLENYFMDYYTALESYQNIYEKRKRILGEKNPDTIRTLSSIAYCHSKLNDHETALSLLRKACGLMEEAEGKNTADSLEMLFAVGRELEYTEIYEEALQIMKEVFQGQSGRAGEKCEDALRALNEQAVILKKLGRLEETLEISEKVYKLAREAYGDDSIDALVYQFNLGSAYYSLKDYSEALSIFETVYARLTDIYGKDNEHTIDALCWKGFCLYQNGRMEEALKSFEEVLPAYVRRYGEYHSRVKNIQNWIRNTRKKLDS